MFDASVRSITCALSLVVLIACSVPVFAQSESGSATIVGVARDQSGAVVPGATITARHAGTQAARVVVTDAEGRFALPALPVGTYSVDAVLQGFQTVRLDRVDLTVGET